MIISSLQHFLFSLRAQNQTYTTLPAKRVYCIYHLFFYGAVLPVGLTKAICLLLSIFKICTYNAQFLIHC